MTPLDPQCGSDFSQLFTLGIGTENDLPEIALLLNDDPRLFAKKEQDYVLGHDHPYLDELLPDRRSFPCHNSFPASRLIRRMFRSDQIYHDHVLNFDAAPRPDVPDDLLHIMAPAQRLHFIRIPADVHLRTLLFEVALSARYQRTKKPAFSPVPIYPNLYLSLNFLVAQRKVILHQENNSD